MSSQNHLEERINRFLKNNYLNEDQIERMRAVHNPKHQPVGHYTGRCMVCHSKNLWDDASA